MKRLCIYAIPGKKAEQARGRYVIFALQKLKEVSDRLVVVTDIDAGHPLYEEIKTLAEPWSVATEQDQGAAARLPAGRCRRRAGGTGEL